MRHALLSFIVCTIAASLAACDDPRDNVVSLHFETTSLVDGEIAITKGQGVNIIGVYGMDTDGNRIDMSDDLEWSSSEPDLVDIHPLGEGALCIGTKDWFDTLVPDPMDGGLDAEVADADVMDDADAGAPVPFEPRSELTVRYGDIEATVTVAVVVNVAGTWQIFLDGNADAPIAELTFRQNGRRITDDLAGADGELEGDAILLRQGPLSLEGMLLSPSRAIGTHAIGSWEAVRRSETVP